MTIMMPDENSLPLLKNSPNWIVVLIALVEQKKNQNSGMCMSTKNPKIKGYER
jgi:hypothetical protein